jgi:hypothetical protein
MITILLPDDMLILGADPFVQWCGPESIDVAKKDLRRLHCRDVVRSEYPELIRPYVGMSDTFGPHLFM